MNTATARSSSGTPLAAGREVALLPVSGGRLVHGTVEGAGGPPGHVRVRLVGGLSTLLRDGPVWAMSRDTDEGLQVHEAVLHRVPDDRAQVALSDVRLLADEQRRAHLRAATQAPVLLVEPGRRSRGTTTIDLSTGGCRVALAYGQVLEPGQNVQVALDIDAGSTVWADGEVLRVDDARHEAAVRFTRLGEADAERVERRLLRSLAGGW